jgi:hypothetical protein
MRLARVLLDDTAAPCVAIERDGCLYDVAELEARWSSRPPSERAGDWFTRVIAMRCAGLASLDDRLARGERPTEARVERATTTLLAPCDETRQTYLEIEREDPGAAGRDHGAPRLHVGLARALVASGATTWLPRGAARAALSIDVAVVLAEDLLRATPDDARRAMLGCALVASCSGPGEDGPAPPESSRQIGPAMVTPIDWQPPRRRACVRTADRILFDGAIVLDVDRQAARLAALTDRVALCAGDVIALGVHAPRLEIPCDVEVEIAVERLGALRARAAARS